MQRKGGKVPRAAIEHATRRARGASSAPNVVERAAALHDLRNLLLIIESSSELVCEETDPRSELYGDLMDIRKAAQRASTLVEEIGGSSSRRVREVSAVDDVVSGLLPILRRVAGPSVAIEYEGGAGKATATLPPAGLERVLVNLVTNARDAMGGAGTIGIATSYRDGRATAVVSETEARSFVRMAIRDTGPGMDKATVARIFDPYFTTKSPAEGSGLGLASVKGLVESARGRVWITTRSGTGTTVFVDLPVTPAR